MWDGPSGVQINKVGVSRQYYESSMSGELQELSVASGAQMRLLGP